MELRFRGFQVFVEIVLAMVLTGFGSMVVVAAATNEGKGPRIGYLFLGSFLVAVLLLRHFRWRQRIRIDDVGVQWRRWRHDFGRSMLWEEIDELFILGPVEFELRGAGKSIVVTPAYDDPVVARDLVSRRLGGLRSRLRDRAMRDGELRFRMPGGRWLAHSLYLILILVLTALTAAAVVPFFFRRVTTGFPLLLLLGGAVAYVWKLRRGASQLGTVVTLYRDGILVRRLDGSRKIAWSEIIETEWNQEGGLDIVMNAGRRVSLPPRLANITLLDGFVEEARTGSGNP